MKTRFPSYSGFIAGTLLIVLSVSILVIGGCQKKETTVQAPAEDLMDPAVMPQIVHTYPPAGGVGPFNVFTPSLDGCVVNDYSYCPLPGHFFLQFNKMMMTATMMEPNIRMTGGEKAAIVHVRGYNSLPLQNVFEFILEPPDQSYNNVAYEVGKVYSVTVDTGVIDGNGNHLSKSFSFSFTPEPAFRMLHSIPRNGDSISVNGQIRVMFNSPIDSSILKGLRLVPPVPGAWYMYNGTDSTVVGFYPYNGFLEESAYTLTFADSAHDRYGHRIEGTRNVVFKTFPFRFLNSSPVDGEELRELNTSINLEFTGPVDPYGLGSGMVVTPSLDGFVVSGNYVFRNAIEHDLKPSTQYTISVTSGLRSSDGTYLQNPSVVHFSTPAFGLESVTPYNNESVVGRATAVRMYFNGRIDTSTIATAFSITPAVAGHFTLSESFPTRAIFSPDEFYTVNTKYTVIIKPTVRSIDGYYSVKPDTSYFIVVQ